MAFTTDRCRLLAACPARQLAEKDTSACAENVQHAVLNEHIMCALFTIVMQETYSSRRPFTRRTLTTCWRQPQHSTKTRQQKNPKVTPGDKAVRNQSCIQCCCCTLQRSTPSKAQKSTPCSEDERESISRLEKASARYNIKTDSGFHRNTPGGSGQRQAPYSQQ